jgi:hypothetical protein
MQRLTATRLDRLADLGLEILVLLRPGLLDRGHAIVELADDLLLSFGLLVDLGGLPAFVASLGVAHVELPILPRFEIVGIGGSELEILGLGLLCRDLVERWCTRNGRLAVAGAQLVAFALGLAQLGGQNVDAMRPRTAALLFLGRDIIVGRFRRIGPAKLERFILRWLLRFGLRVWRLRLGLELLEALGLGGGLRVGVRRSCCYVLRGCFGWRVGLQMCGFSAMMRLVIALRLRSEGAQSASGSPPA